MPCAATNYHLPRARWGTLGHAKRDFRFDKSGGSPMVILGRRLRATSGKDNRNRRGRPLRTSGVLASCMIIGTLSTVVLQAGTAEAVSLVWSVTPSPNPSSNNGAGLDGVSCVSTVFCMAVGYYNGPSQPLVESWDGSSWAITPSPSPNDDSQNSYLSDVSCTSSTNCVAVGTYWTNSSVVVPQTLVESWNGAAWSK